MEALANRKPLTDLLETTIKENGVEAAIRQYHELKSTERDSYDLDDMYALSDIGRDLLKAKKTKEAIELLQLNTETFPGWWWAYDDLGQAYREAGDKQLAIENYKKSLQLDPLNENATLQLKQLNAQ